MGAKFILLFSACHQDDGRPPHQTNVRPTLNQRGNAEADDLVLLAAGLLAGRGPHCKRTLTFVRDVFRCGGRAVGRF